MENNQDFKDIQEFIRWLKQTMEQGHECGNPHCLTKDVIFVLSALGENEEAIEALSWLFLYIRQTTQELGGDLFIRKPKDEIGREFLGIIASTRKQRQQDPMDKDIFTLIDALRDNEEPLLKAAFLCSCAMRLSYAVTLYEEMRKRA